MRVLCRKAHHLAITTHCGSGGSIVAQSGHAREFRPTLAPAHALTIGLKRARGRAISVQHESCGFLNLHPFGEVQAEGAIGRHVVIDQGCERPEILLSHLTEVPRLGQQALNE